MVGEIMGSCRSSINFKDPAPWAWTIKHNNKEILWFENPKTGSTSMKYFLKSLGILVDSERLFAKNNPIPEKKQKIIKVVNNKFSETFKFGICRDPINRTISAYRMSLRSPANSGLSEKQVKNLKFESFVNNIVTGKWQNHHWAPQHWFLPIDKIKFDIIFKLEKIRDNFSIITDQLNIGDEEFPHRQGHGTLDTIKYDIEPYLNNEKTIQQIQEYYSKDFEIYESGK